MWAHGWVKSPRVGVTGNYGLVMICLKHLIHRKTNKSSHTLDQIAGRDTSQVYVRVCCRVSENNDALMYCLLSDEL